MEIKTYRLSGMTCGSCAMRIEKAISELAAVESARVNFQKREIAVVFKKTADSSLLTQALAKLGNYRLEEEDHMKSKKPMPAWSWGIGGFLIIVTIFFLVQAVGMQSVEAPLEFMLSKWYFVLPLSIGFGAQAWLFRSIHLMAGHGGGNAMAASGGMSSGTMFACCLHNLVPLFPILGISGITAFFAAYQTSVFLFSILITFLGVGYMFQKYQTMKRAASGG